MQHVKNAIGGNAMKMLKMHQNALKCTRMRMGKINTTFGKKQQQSLAPNAPDGRPGSTQRGRDNGSLPEGKGEAGNARETHKGG